MAPTLPNCHNKTEAAVERTFATPFLEPVKAMLVIKPALLLVRENLVGLGNLLELRDKKQTTNTHTHTHTRIHEENEVGVCVCVWNASFEQKGERVGETTPPRSQFQWAGNPTTAVDTNALCPRLQGCGQDGTSWPFSGKPS